MPTNPIGKHTCNLSLNIPQAERRILGRLAHKRRQSVGAFAKSMILRGMLTECPADAALIIRINGGR